MRRLRRFPLITMRGTKWYNVFYISMGPFKLWIFVVALVPFLSLMLHLVHRALLITQNSA